MGSVFNVICACYLIDLVKADLCESGRRILDSNIIYTASAAHNCILGNRIYYQESQLVTQFMEHVAVICQSSSKLVIVLLFSKLHSLNCFLIMCVIHAFICINNLIS